MKKLLFFLAVLLLPLSLHAQQKEADALFRTLVEAEIANDYNAFMSKADIRLKAALTQQQFEASAAILKKKLALGYEISPLGQIKQHGYDVFLFRIRPTGSTDDIVGYLSMTNGKMGGIFFE